MGASGGGTKALEGSTGPRGAEPLEAGPGASQDSEGRGQDARGPEGRDQGRSGAARGGLGGGARGAWGPKGGALGAEPGGARGALGQSRQSPSSLPVTVAEARWREGKEGGLSYILKNRDRELEASRPRCRRFLLQRAQRPGLSFLKPLPLLPSLLEQCGAQAAAVEDRPAAAAPAAAEKEGGKHKAGCELRAAR